MKVEKINNYTVQNAKRRFDSPNFTGGMGTVAQEITNSLPAKNILKKLQSFEWLKGEMGSILITALGTGLVAPIFIAFNPFVRPKKDATKEQKEDVKNTKIYTAMRQPISAILAILFQVSALKPIDKALDAMLNNPAYSKNFSLHVDQAALNSKSYLKTKIKKELKQSGIKKPSIFKYFSENYSKVKEERRHYDKMLNDKVTKKQEQQIQLLAERFQQTGKIKIGERYLDNPTLAELINKQIDQYISDAKHLYTPQDGIEFYRKRANILINNEEHLKEIFKDVPVKETFMTKDPDALKQLYKQTNSILESALSKETNEDVKMLIREILDKPEDIRASRVSRTLERIKSIKSACGGNYSEQAYINHMNMKNTELEKIINKLKLKKIDEVASATDNTISETLKKLIESCKFDKEDKLINSILHDTKTFGTNEEKLAQKIHKDIIKLYKKFVENKYTAPNQITKILISVCITLPITCNALNWVYPRVMEKLFPRISGVKKEGGSDGSK